MKYNSQLVSATLLKRQFKFLVTAVIDGKQKYAIRCPNLGEIKGCDILGSNIWFSKAIGHQCLDSWELVEADGGHLVSINPELVKPLLIEGIKQNNIPELENYDVIQSNFVIDSEKRVDILLESNTKRCYIMTELVLHCDVKGNGLCPIISPENKDLIRDLLKQKKESDRVILFLSVQHMGIERIKISDRLFPGYNKLLTDLCKEGLEIMAYKAHVTTESIELKQSIPVLLSEISTAK